jgi:hypothetical protein
MKKLIIAAILASASVSAAAEPTVMADNELAGLTAGSGTLFTPSMSQVVGGTPKARLNEDLAANAEHVIFIEGPTEAGGTYLSINQLIRFE